MNTKMLTLLGGLVLASALGAASAAPAAAPAVAAAPKAQDIFAALDAAKISLDDAVKVAEKSVAGKPIKAILDEESTPVAYRVAIADSTNRTVTFVKIDSVTGSVLDSRVYHPDNKAKAGAAVGVKPAPAAKLAAPAVAPAPAAAAPAASTPATDNPLKKPSARAKPSTQGTATAPATTAPAASTPATTAPAPAATTK